MLMRTAFRFFVLLVGVVLCAPAAAEKNELAIALGLRSGGELEITGTGRSPNLNATVAYGLIYNRGLGPETFLTTFWSHQSTELSAPGEFSNGDSFGIDIDDHTIAQLAAGTSHVGDVADAEFSKFVASKRRVASARTREPWRASSISRVESTVMSVRALATSTASSKTSTLRGMIVASSGSTRTWRDDRF